MSDLSFWSAVSGSLNGALHGLTGPDHLAALLPFCIGKSYHGWKIGFYWGLGHGLGIVSFGCLTYLLKSIIPFDLDILAKWLELAVGISLVAVGLMGIREVSEELSKKKHSKKDEDPEKPFEETKGSKMPKTSDLANPTTALYTGIIQGLTGSGHFFGIMPALTLPSLLSAMLYLSFFCGGTVVAMVLFTAAVGEMSVRMTKRGGTVLSSPTQLAFYASVFSVGFGVVLIVWSLVIAIKSSW